MEKEQEGLSVGKSDFCSNLDSIIPTNMPKYLCSLMEGYGKAFVMNLSCENRLNVRFNKYEGACEWKNCIYLWVNIGGTSGYDNVFSENGNYMMWFGGKRMKKGHLFINFYITCLNTTAYILNFTPM